MNSRSRSRRSFGTARSFATVLGQSNPATRPWDDGGMSNATIIVDAALKARLAELARHSGHHVDEFVEAVLRRIANADIRLNRGIPVLPRRPGAPTVSVEDVDRLADGVINQATPRSI